MVLIIPQAGIAGIAARLDEFEVEAALLNAPNQEVLRHGVQA